MRTMCLVLSMIIFTALIVGFGWWWSTSPPPEADLSNARAEKPSAVAITAPGRYTGYEAMSQQDKLDLISRHMHHKELDAVDLAFLKQELANKELLATLRNNIANTLCWQRRPDPELFRSFIGFIDDASESMTWREYSVQFLAETLRFASEPATVIAKLRDLAQHDDAGLGGTAIIHLALQADAGRVDLGPDFEPRLVELMDDPDAAVRARMAAVGVLAKRGARHAVDRIRALVASKTTEPGLRRVALAALGQLGDAAIDGPVLRQALSDDNRAVVMAAEGALRRLGVHTQ